MSNSSLVSFTKISPNKNSPRKNKIDTITIHCMAGQLSCIECGNLFAKTTRKASSNYGIGPDGKIGLYVEEKDRSWASSNAANDNRAITIEVASDSKYPYAVKEPAYNALIDLLVDICKRNNIKKLIYSDNKNDRIYHRNGTNMTLHVDFSPKKECPGFWLISRHHEIANKVNTRLGTADATIDKPTSPITSTVVPNGGEKVKIIERGGLNIRSGPSTNYTVTGKCNYGDIKLITAYSGTWGKISTGGWINCSEKYVEKIVENSSTVKTNTKPQYIVGKVYTLLAEMKIRKGPGTNYEAKSYMELTDSAKKYDKDKDGALEKDTKVSCLEVKSTAANEIWMRIPSGWVMAYNKGTVYIR